MLKEGNMITLADGVNYGLLIETTFKEENYFLSVRLTEKEEPTNDFKVLKEIKKDEKTFVIEEKDPFILAKLIEEYRIIAQEEQ